jgi:hypothetical protein
VVSALLAFDAANPAISIAAMTQHGAIAAPVYIRGTPGGFQPSDKKRVAALREAGLAPWPNWESTADFFADCTLDEARAAGEEARDCASRLGFPDDGTISVPFSFDYQVPTDKFQRALDVLNACRDGLGEDYQATSYAQSSLITFFGRHGFGNTGHWLMASTFQNTSSIPQPSDVYDIGSEFVCMVQSHHADGSWFDTPVPGTDVNTVTRPDKLAAWWPDDSEFGMPSAAEIARAVWNLKLSDGERVQSAAAWLKQAHHLSDPAGIATLVLAKLPDDGPGLTPAQIRAAVEDGVGELLAAADPD